jgi:uroporphyrinogen-III synthase
LQSLQWDWSTKKVVIFKGDGGREWLADTLKKAGATVDTLSTYARVPLDIDHHTWGVIRTTDLSQSLWLLTSSEAVRYLGQVAQEQFPDGLQSLQTASAICSHHNIADAAEMIGFGEVFTTESGDDALVKATLAWLSL